jgi:hypothetical protein
MVDGVEWSCEFRFHGESYGWDARLVRAGEFFASQRFVMRATAERWATEQRQQIERGWSTEETMATTGARDEESTHPPDDQSR